jgi:hypothetical protein
MKKNRFNHGENQENNERRFGNKSSNQNNSKNSTNNGRRFGNKSSNQNQKNGVANKFVTIFLSYFFNNSSQFYFHF